MCSTANKGQSTVSYRQSSAFDCPYLSCNDHCDQWLFQEILFYYYYFYFLEIFLNNLELVFLEFRHIYKTKIKSCFLFICLFFTCCFVSFCLLTFSAFSYFSDACKHRMSLFSFCAITLYNNALHHLHLDRFIKTNP